MHIDLHYMQVNVHIMRVNVHIMRGIFGRVAYNALAEFVKCI